MSGSLQELRRHLSEIAAEASPPAGLADRARRSAKTARARTAMIAAVAFVVMAGGIALGLQNVAAGPNRAVATAPTVPQGGSPGTAITAGIRNPVGTLVLGTVFPTPTGKQAVLLVTGEPFQALRDMRTEIVSAGLRLVPQDTDPCSTDPITLQPTRTRVNVMNCSFRALSTTGHGTTLRVIVTLLLSLSATPYEADMLVQADTIPTSVAGPTPPPGSTVTLPTGHAPVQPRPAVSVPPEGHSFGDPYGQLGEAYHVVTGSQFQAPPFRVGCVTGGFYAVAKATMPVTRVAAAYVQQFEGSRLTVDPTVTVPASVGTYVYLSDAGGGDASVATATTATGDGYVLLTRCND